MTDQVAMAVPAGVDDSFSPGSGAEVLCPDSGRARLVRLRPGCYGDRLYLVPGLEGVAEELAPLVESFSGRQEVFAVLPPDATAPDTPADLHLIAEAMVAAVRDTQPTSPYQLGGYSFGGLLAFEMARQLRSVGENVSALFLIDAVYDERYWPRRIWAEALLRRTGRQLNRIASMRPPEALSEFRHRSSRLAQRFSRRRTGAADGLQAGETPAARRAYVAIAGYRPSFYDGTITLISPTVDSNFGVDTPLLWKSLANRIEVRRIAGDHLSIMHDPDSAAAVARTIDHKLAVGHPGWPGLRPQCGFGRPMVVTTMKWFSAARLANALLESGFEVSTCRPRTHPLDAVEGLTSVHSVNRFDRIGSIARAIRKTRPDIVLPDDERALVLLRRLHARIRLSDPEMSAVLARSLGNVADWQVLASRTGQADVARDLGVAAPRTAVVRDLDAVQGWVDRHGLPIVLKTDGSWGGRGVVIAREAREISTAWRTAVGPPALPKAVKRLLLDFEAGPLFASATRKSSVVNAQQFTEGRDAIATAACLDGRVLSIVCLEVVRAMPNQGAAAVVRLIDNPSMVAAAERLIQRLGLTGFCGFDFIISDTGEPELLEINPRVTPTAYLLVEGWCRDGGTIALFPPDVVAEAAPYDVDVPARSPALVRAGRQIAARERGLRARAERKLSRRIGQ